MPVAVAASDTASEAATTKHATTEQPASVAAPGGPPAGVLPHLPARPPISAQSLPLQPPLSSADPIPSPPRRAQMRSANTSSPAIDPSLLERLQAYRSGLLPPRVPSVAELGSFCKKLQGYGSTAPPMRLPTCLHAAATTAAQVILI
eukprot:COSAG01_NODE_319_length_18909_cov_32.636151_16_plen_147_part_00